MNNFTYETQDREEKYEVYEWDNVWLEYASDPDRKRVLYIGDSISCGTRNVATGLTGNKLLFDGFGTSKAVDNKYFKDALKVFANQQKRRDVVIFNNGLHGWHLDDKQYEFYYDDMIRFITEEFKGTPVLIALTTYVAKPERESRVVSRNEVATRIAQKYGLPIIDLHTITMNSKDLLTNDGVHYTGEGYEIIATQILEDISEFVDFN